MRKWGSLYLWLIRFLGLIVPRRLRADWRQEWEAELQWRERQLAEWDRLDSRHKLELWQYSLGAFADALWLQPKRWEDEMMQDIRFAMRMLNKQRNFTSLAVLMLALGIGANTAIFSIIRPVLIEPLPFAQPERLLQARLTTQGSSEQIDWVSPRDMVDWQERSRIFERMGFYRFATLDLPDGELPEAIYGVRLSHGLLPMLGVRPALGRFFLPEEDRSGANQTIILSDDWWRRRFAARTDIIGQTIHANDGDYVVVGVMPPGFNFPLRLATNLRVPSRQMGFWLAWGADPRQGKRNNTNGNAILQLKTGKSIQQAQAELDAINAQLARDFPQTNTGRGARLISLKEQTVGNTATLLWVLFGAVGLVVLLVCANIASLLLVQTDGRRKEMAVRQALGASVFRLARQTMTESLLLAGLGGAAGALLAAWSLKLLIGLSPHNVPRLTEARIDGKSLAFTVAVTLAAGALFGAAPAWRAMRVNLNESLKDAAANSRRGSWLATGNLMVGVEISLALALTLGTGLLLNSFLRLQRVDPGFQAQGVSAAVIVLPRTKYPDGAASAGFFRRVIESLEAMPGIESASTSNSLPMSGHGGALHINIEGRPSVIEDDPARLSALHFVSTNYLRTMGIPLLRGRIFTSRDIAGTPAVALINEAAAQRFWPGEDPLGKRLRYGSSPWHQVAGVVKNTYRQQLDETPGPEVYALVEQQPIPTQFLSVRSALTPADTADAMRRAVAGVDSQQPIFVTMTMESLLADAVAKQRFGVWLLGIISGLALLLAALGVYGVVAYTVACRTREIGIRIALGAQGNHVLRLMMLQGMKPVALGAGVGLLSGFFGSRVLSGMLYGVKATDPITYFIVSLVLVLIALLACWLPARRAAKIDPLIAIRCE